MNNGKIIRLSDYCVVEYISPDPREVQTPIDADFIRLHNKYSDNVQFFNSNGDIKETNNIQDFTLVQTSGNSYVSIDVDKVPNYLDKNENFIYDSPYTDPFIYDTVRFHFISGFLFNEFKALIFTIKNKMNNGKDGIFSNFLLNSLIMQDVIELNPHPIFLSNAFFDRYFEIKIPSIKQMNKDYNSSPDASTTLAAILSPRLNETGDGFDGYIGYVTDSPIIIGLSESNTYMPLPIDQVVYDSYVINNHYELSLEQSSEFDGLTADIKESEEGNYIEYSLMKYGGFPNEFIGYLNGKKPNNNWVVIHELRVYESVSGTEIQTSDSMYFQTDKFEEYLKFRPVLEYAENAIAFSIEYLVRLTNQYDGEQIIRKGSGTFYNPKAYGKDTRSLIANITAQPYKIYNKIIMKKGFDKTNMYVDPDFNDIPNPPITEPEKEVITQKVYVPYVINYARVGLSNHSAYNSIISSDSFIYGQGKYPMVITPMDNLFKFIIHEQDKDGVYKPMDLNIGRKYRLVFRTGGKASKEIKIDLDTPQKERVQYIPRRPITAKTLVSKPTEIKDVISPLGALSDTRSSLPIKDPSVYTTSNILGTVEIIADNVAEISNAREGELLFRVQKVESGQLYRSTSGEFYITILSEVGVETVLYRGTWNKMSEDKKIRQKESDARIKDIDVRIKEKFVTTPDKQTAQVRDTTAPKITELRETPVSASRIPKLTTGPTKSPEYDIQTNTVISDNPAVDVPEYVSLYDKNRNVSVVTKIIPKQTLIELEKGIAQTL